MSSNLTLIQAGFSNITIRGTSSVLVMRPVGGSVVNLRSGAIVPLATANTAGSVIVGANLTVNSNGVLSVILPANYTLPVANATQLGGVKVGANLAIDGNGVLSANSSGGGVTSFNNRTGNVSLTANDVTSVVSGTYMPALSNVTVLDVQPINIAPASTGTMPGWQTNGTSGACVTRSTFGQYGLPKGFGSVVERRANATALTNQIGIVVHGHSGLCSCSTTYGADAYTTAYTSLIQTQSAASISASRFGVSNNVVEGIASVTVNQSPLSMNPLTGNGVMSCMTVSKQSSVCAIKMLANDTNSYAGLISPSLTRYYDSDSLLTQGYADTRYYPLTGNPSGFLTALPIATNATLGGVKIGANLSVDSNGILSANTPNLTPYLTSATAASTYVPKACGTSYFAVYDGDIIIGTTKATAELQDNYIQIQKALVGDVSHPPLGGSSGINIGENWLGNSTRPYVSLMGSIDYYYWADDSILCRKYADSRYLLTSNYTPYTLPAATNTTLGGVIVGNNLTIANGVLSAVASGGLDSNSTIDGGTF